MAELLKQTHSWEVRHSSDGGLGLPGSQSLAELSLDLLPHSLPLSLLSLSPSA